MSAERQCSHEMVDGARRAWERNARWWDATFGEGNDFHLRLVAPPTERLLEIGEGEAILDIACGNGAFSRRMATLGARIVAIDFCEAFLACARERTAGFVHRERIDYRIVDVTDPGALRTLGNERFAAAVCTMAIMDIADLVPLAEALPRLLKPVGRFVFSVLHPCFNNPSCRTSAELEDRQGELRTMRSVRVVRYLTPYATPGIGIPGQPIPQTYFHRPLHVLLRPFLANGFVLDGLEEMAFADPSNARSSLSWAHYPEIPPVLVVRLTRRMASS